MKVTICDRCGDIITGKPRANGGPAEPSVVRFIDRPSLSDDAQDIELCGDCYAEVRAVAKVRIAQPVSVS